MSDTVQNGKGSKPRPYKAQTYADNFDQIDWGKGRKKIEKKLSKTEELQKGLELAAQDLALNPEDNPIEWLQRKLNQDIRIPTPHEDKEHKDQD